MVVVGCNIFGCWFLVVRHVVVGCTTFCCWLFGCWLLVGSLVERLVVGWLVVRCSLVGRLVGW